MSEMIKYAVECSSLYGMMSVLFICVTMTVFCVAGSIAIVKLVKHIGSIITKYRDVSAKAVANKVSIETELHR